jgi:hypothetical protein
MAKNPVLDVPLSEVMRSEFALPLQQMLQLYTVGNFLGAWRNPKTQKGIEQVFDTPQQARHAAATCAAWLGLATPPHNIQHVQAWWRKDEGYMPAGVMASVAASAPVAG